MKSTYTFRKLITLIISPNRGAKNPGGVIRLMWGPGAGYIGGFTVYAAYNSGSTRYARNFRNWTRSNGTPVPWLTRRTGIEIGITRNANLVPFPYGF